MRIVRDVAVETDPLKHLARLSRSELAEAHRAGACPSPQEFGGVADGLVLTTPIVRGLRLWRGKTFDANADGSVTGLNRLGIGGFERRRYRFEARVAPSLFGDREVLYLDHDLPVNPFYIRRFHDELVRVDERTYLATSHYRVGDRLIHLCYFAVHTPA